MRFARYAYDQDTSNVARKKKFKPVEGTPKETMTMKLFSAMLAAATLLAAGWTHAQTWPERALQLVVGFPAGGGVDIVARQLADRLSEQLGQRVTVENRAGANGNVAMATRYWLATSAIWRSTRRSTQNWVLTPSRTSHQSRA